MKIGTLNEHLAMVAARLCVNLLAAFMIATLAGTPGAHAAVHYQILKSFTGEMAEPRPQG